MAETTPKKTAGEAFTLKTWMGGGTRPSRYVELYANNDLQSEIDYLERQIAEAEEKAGGTWGGAAGTGDIEKRLDALREEMSKSVAWFKVRALDPNANDEIARKHPYPEGASPEETALVTMRRWPEQVSRQIVAFGPAKDDMQPVTLTVEDVIELQAQVGEVEYMKLVDACQETMSNVSATTPFWHGSSGKNRS